MYFHSLGHLSVCISKLMRSSTLVVFAWACGLLLNSHLAIAQKASNQTNTINPASTTSQSSTSSQSSTAESTKSELQLATFGGGCFWCVEAVFENMEGVTNVVSGYAGGNLPNPSYEQVRTGQTGHAEVCQVSFDPEKVSYLKLLEVFLKTHDPTTVDKQGPDYGPQYRSIIFFHSDEQRDAAKELIERLDQSKAFRNKIVTQVAPYTVFYPAEEYHQDYYRKHPNETYCKMYVRPKITKFKKVIQELERKEKNAKPDKPS